MDWCTTLHVQIGGMNAQRFGEYLVLTQQQLDPDELMFFIYDGAPAHGNAANPGANTQLKLLPPPYSPFLNIVEQAISTLKAALKADISQSAIQIQLNNRDEARRQGIALGAMRQRILLEASERNMNTVTPHKCAQWYRFRQIYMPRCLNRQIEG